MSKQLSLITLDTVYPLLKSTTPFKPTHVLRAPNPKGSEHFVPCVMELHIGSPIVLDALVKAGWTILEEIHYCPNHPNLVMYETCDDKWGTLWHCSECEYQEQEAFRAELASLYDWNGGLSKQS